MLIPKCVQVNIDDSTHPDEVREFILFLDASLKDKIPKVKSSGVSAVKNLRDALKSEEGVYKLCSQVLGEDFDI